MNQAFQLVTRTAQDGDGWPTAKPRAATGVGSRQCSRTCVKAYDASAAKPAADAKKAEPAAAAPAAAKPATGAQAPTEPGQAAEAARQSGK